MNKRQLEYRINEKIAADDFADLLNRSTLGQRRPVDDMECLQGMLEYGNLLITCWDNNKLVGVSRSVTDFHYACYLSDLAVDIDNQRQGIGKALIRLTKEQLGPKCQLILIAAPAAADYYSPLGFENHPRCWVMPGNKTLAS